jgi:hypothetical protein
LVPGILFRPEKEFENVVLFPSWPNELLTSSSKTPQQTDENLPGGLFPKNMTRSIRNSLKRGNFPQPWSEKLQYRI